MKSNHTLIVDVGGTHTRFNFRRKNKFISTDVMKLPQQIRQFMNGKPLDHLIVGMKGVWTRSEKFTWKKKLKGIAPKITVLSDVELAHWKIFGDQPGIILISGTGSICYGRSSTGKTARAGGLGPLLGDEGSGFWIGKEYLIRNFRKNPTKFDLQLIRRTVTHPDVVKNIAALTPRVFSHAQRQSKSIEAQILREAQYHLKTLVHSVKKQLGEKQLPVTIWGSVAQRLMK